jgi:hypothetical protein
MNLAGNLLPSSFYQKRGGHKLPNIVATTYKSDGAIDEHAAAREILSQYLVGKEGEPLLAVWMKQFEDAMKA